MTAIPDREQSGLMAAVGRRRSVRRYDERPVPRELIMECVEAAALAPSACHVQPWRFLVVDEPARRDELAAAAFSGVYKATRFAAEAPVIVALLSRFDWFVQGAGRQIQGTQYHLLDAGIAGEHFVLRAAELGLGTCWIGWYHRRRTRRVLRLPRRYRICALIAVGWPAADLELADKERKTAADIAAFNAIDFRADR